MKFSKLGIIGICSILAISMVALFPILSSAGRDKTLLNTQMLGGIPAILVVDSDSRYASIADYVTNGSHDEVEIQQANDAAEGGIVALSIGEFRIDDDLIIDNCTLVGQGPGGTSTDFSTQLTVRNRATIIVTADKIVGRLHNVSISVPYSGFEGTALEVIGTNRFSGVPDILDNVRLFNYHKTGTALHIHGEATSLKSKFIQFCSFGSINISRFDTGLHLSGMNETGDSTQYGYVNGNTFSCVQIYGSNNPFVTSGTGSTSGNIFSAVIVESGAGAVNGIYFGSKSAHNMMFLQEWTNAGFYTGSQILLDRGSTLNYILGVFQRDEVNDQGNCNRVEYLGGCN